MSSCPKDSVAPADAFTGVVPCDGAGDGAGDEAASEACLISASMSSCDIELGSFAMVSDEVLGERCEVRQGQLPHGHYANSLPNSRNTPEKPT